MSEMAGGVSMRAASARSGSRSSEKMCRSDSASSRRSGILTRMDERGEEGRVGLPDPYAVPAERFGLGKDLLARSFIVPEPVRIRPGVEGRRPALQIERISAGWFPGDRPEELASHC